MDAAQAWQAVRGQLQTEMPKAAFDTWVKDAEYISFEDGSFILGVKNAYARDWLDSRLSSTIARLLTGLLNRSIDVHFIVWQDTVCEKQLKETIEFIDSDVSFSPNPSINSRYTFQNFVVGPSNRLAHAACMAVAERPAQAYNPLFLYGGVGLGKTHLLHAIGNACHNKNLEVLYVSSEVFTNDLISAIRSHTTQAFRDKYRNTDVLLVDDIQFIAGKESTQEEFFHTFNTLHGQDKQIVVSSDRPPKALITLEERLCSRFEWGLAADIQPPDLETRLAILHAKREKLGTEIPDDLLELIARRVQSNIRELEGSLTRVSAFADLSGLSLCPQLVETALGDLLPRRFDIAPEEILRTVAGYYKIDLETLLGRNRSRQVALPRQIAMYLMRQEANISLPQIGEALGGRDHTTVMYACDKISEMMASDDRFRREILQIKDRLFGVKEDNRQRVL